MDAVYVPTYMPVVVVVTDFITLVHVPAKKVTFAFGTDSWGVFVAVWAVVHYF